MKHEKHAGIAVSIVLRIHTNEFDVAVSKPAPQQDLRRFLTKVWHDLDANGTAGSEPARGKDGSPQACTEIDENVVALQLDHSEQPKNVSIWRRRLMNPQIVIIRFA